MVHYEMNPHLDPNVINNNNHILQLDTTQALPGYPYNMAPDLTPPQASAPLPSKFTFGTPTQTSSFSYQGPISLVNAPICHAPGIGTSWQHTIPTQIGLVVHTNPGLVTYTSNLEPSVVDSTGSSPFYANTGIPVASCIPYCRPTSSCSITPRGTKRRGEDMTSDIKRKIFLSEKKMLEKMKGLSLQHQSESGEERIPTAFQKEQQISLERLREIEARLNDEDMEPISIEKFPKGPRLEIIDGLEKEIFKPSSLLPQKILQDMCSKPCMEVVLWKPPPHVSTSPIICDQAPESTSATKDQYSDASPVSAFNSQQQNHPSVMSWSSLPPDESSEISDISKEMETTDESMVL